LGVGAHTVIIAEIRDVIADENYLDAWCECFCTLEDKFGVNWSLLCGAEKKLNACKSI
jgi:hypothetical protein